MVPHPSQLLGNPQAFPRREVTCDVQVACAIDGVDEAVALLDAGASRVVLPVTTPPEV